MDHETVATFGTSLKDFSLATDAITKRDFEIVVNRVVSYINETLKCGIRDIIIAVQKYNNENRATLFGAWPKDDDDTNDTYWSHELYNSDGTVHGQSSFVLINNRAGWFVTEDKKNLNDNNAYRDLLGNYNSEIIPPFVSALGIGFKTSVIFPCTEKGIKNIVNFEFKKYTKPTELWEKELKLIAEGISILYRAWQNYTLQEKDIGKAIKSLDERNIQLPKSEPIAIIFSPKDGRKDVKDNIQSTLAHYVKYFKPVYWEEINQQGEIIENIRKNASEAILGVAYLSEEKEEAMYRDNPNVLYEAGMLDGFAYNDSTPLKGILLIREKHSGAIPFNIQGRKIIMVERDATNKLNSEKFEKTLKADLKSIDNSWVPQKL